MADAVSGWSPKYFPPQLVRAASRQLRTKVLFGTDYPYIQLDRWRRDFDDLGQAANPQNKIVESHALAEADDHHSLLRHEAAQLDPDGV